MERIQRKLAFQEISQDLMVSSIHKFNIWYHGACTGYIEKVVDVLDKGKGVVTLISVERMI